MRVIYLTCAHVTIFYSIMCHRQSCLRAKTIAGMTRSFIRNIIIHTYTAHIPWYTHGGGVVKRNLLPFWSMIETYILQPSERRYQSAPLPLPASRVPAKRTPPPPPPPPPPSPCAVVVFEII